MTWELLAGAATGLLLVWLLIGYLALPVDLVPDVIPVIGYADDAVLVVWTLRAVLHRAGSAALERHWPGTPTASPPSAGWSVPS